MRLRSLYLKNFRSFGPAWEPVRFDDLTCFVGPNGAGKTAILQALARMFGSDSQRRFVREDFHVPAGADPDQIASASLAIEADIEFPTEADTGASAEFWRNLVIPGEGQPLTVRFYLQANWVRGNSPEGTTDASLYFVQVPHGETMEDPREEDLFRVPAEIRSRIQVHYVPATRDPSTELRSQGAGHLHRLVQALVWPAEQKAAIEKESKELGKQLRQHSGISTIETQLTEAWRRLHTTPTYEQVNLQPLPTRFEDVLRHIEPSLHSDELGRATTVKGLSDGQRSLFHLGLVQAVQVIQQMVLADAELKQHFSEKELDVAHLTILAIEEPENHLSPHFLGRIMKGLRDLTQGPHVQLAITSHSASILARVEPEEIRHLRLGPGRTTRVARITVPEEPDGSKFVRGAVRTYPELYFSELVILGEGDSEETILPHLLGLGGVNCDTAMISVVPLAGRHVQHLWRLLNQIGIPFLTLLDRDDGREGGGWPRIKYVVEQLHRLGKEPTDICVVAADGTPRPTTNDVMESMASGTGLDLDATTLKLREYGVFYSAPLDLDWLLYDTFTGTYIETAAGEPRIPAQADDARDKAAREAVLGDGMQVPETLASAMREDWYWYRYLFLTRSKPTTHLLALEELRAANTKLAAWPEPLQALVATAHSILSPPEPEVQDAVTRSAAT